MDKRNLAGFSADTEVLTRTQGWVTFDQLTRVDEVATRSPEGRFEWQYPESVRTERYDGEMVRLYSRNTDLLVTPGCRVLYMHRRRMRVDGVLRDLPYEERTLLAGGAVGQRLSLVATSRWEPVAPQTQVAFTATRGQTYGGRAANRGSDYSASSADFAAFMGMYLAEGNLSAPSHPGHNIWIWQKRHGRGYAEYQDLLNGLLGREIPQISKGGWHFSNKALCAYLRPCGSRAWTKIIPAEVLNLARGDLERFWRFYSLGDGTVTTMPGRKPVESVSTTSRRMAGQLQEILQKLGGWAMIQVIDYSKYQTIAATNHLTYRLVRRAGDVAFATRIERLPRQGLIGCVGSGAHAVYVRRNYRPVWAGGAIG